jgi:hypothetical protein
MRTQWFLVAAATVALTLWAASCAPQHAGPSPVEQVLHPGGAVSATEPTLPGGKIPDKPYDWQKRPKGSPPRCGTKEVLIAGACYRRAHPDDYSPPCESPTVQWGSTCFYAIHKAIPPESSIGREK